MFRILGKLGFQTPFHCFSTTSQPELDLPLPHTHLVFSNTETKARETGILLLKAEEVFHFHWESNGQQSNRRGKKINLLLGTCS